MNIETTWTIFKSLISDKNLKLQELEVSSNYYLFAFDGPFSISCIIPKTTPAGTDQDDYEDNFQSQANQPITQRFIQNTGDDVMEEFGVSHSFTATKTTTTTSDFAIPNNIRGIAGSSAFFPNAVAGDYFKVVIIDKDNVTGLGANTIISTPVNRWFVFPGVPMTKQKSAITPVSMDGLYIRVIYVSTGILTDVTCLLNFFSYKAAS